MLNKSFRHASIKQIILNVTISSQNDLISELSKQGIEVNQSTLSRDMKELRIVRISTEEGFKYIMDNHLKHTPRYFKRLLSYEIQSIQNNGTLIAIKTLPGCAQSVAQAIDSLNLESIMGTIAGDDSIFVAPHNAHEIPTIASKLKSFLC